ncbi:hypothetical protein GCM10029964_022510 [Kibdelosporangium lantanae]
MIVVEKDKFGGTCLHRGCIPTKALLHAAEIADNVREGDQFGVKSSLEGIDINGVNSYKDGVVAQLYKGLQGLAKLNKVQLVEGTGKFVAPNVVEVGGDRYIGKNVVLASGSYAKTLPGLDIGGRIITSDQALNLDYVPERVVVLGGGVIGVEFASVWKSFGADVTIVEALPGSCRWRTSTRPSSSNGLSASAGSSSRPGSGSPAPPRPTTPSRCRWSRVTSSRPTCCWWPSAGGRTPPPWATRKPA